VGVPARGRQSLPGRRSNHLHKNHIHGHWWHDHDGAPDHEPHQRSQGAEHDESNPVPLGFAVEAWGSLGGTPPRTAL
jgi:hypothetical protein